MRGFVRRSPSRHLFAASLVLAAVGGVAGVRSSEAAAFPPKCWAYHNQPPCLYDVRIETAYTNGAFQLGSTFSGTVSARMTATFRRVPLLNLWTRGSLVSFGYGVRAKGGWETDVFKHHRGTLQATVSADVRSVIEGSTPCRIRGSYGSPALLTVFGNVDTRLRYSALNLSYGLARRLSVGCPGTAVRLHHLVDGHRFWQRPLGGGRDVYDRVDIGGAASPAAPNRSVREFDWAYEYMNSSRQGPVAPWAPLAGGRSFGFTRTYTTPGEPTTSSGSFGTSQSATVRVTFKRVR